MTDATEGPPRHFGCDSHEDDEAACAGWACRAQLWPPKDSDLAGGEARHALFMGGDRFRS